MEEHGISFTLDEIEQERQGEIVHMQDRLDKPLDEIEHCFNTPMGMHEALHAAYMMTDMVSQFLLEHPCVVLDPVAWKYAFDAHTALFNLYQFIGCTQNDIIKRQEEELL